MIQRRRFRLSLAMAVAALAVAGSAVGRSLYGEDRSASAAPARSERSRAELERKSRELKKKVETRHKEAEARQREVRERLNLSNSAGPTSGRAGAALAKPTPPRLPGSEALRKNLKEMTMPDPRSLAKTPPGRKKNSVEYSPGRGQEIAFLVEMSAQEGGIQKQWIGTPYFAGIFSDIRRSFAEMLCIGSLECRIRSSSDRPWSPDEIEDIELPQRFMFGSSGVMNTRTTSLFDQPTLPLQLSALLPVEELIFPALPAFSDSPRNETKEPSTFYLRGGQKNILGDTPTTTLKGEFRRVSRIEQENSTTPRIVNERGFQCPAQDVGLSFRQVASIDAREGMVVNVDLDYLLEMDEHVRLTVKVRRLYGDDLAKARANALKKLPPADWPEYFRRVPADNDEFALLHARSADSIPAGQRVSVSIDINERDAHGSRDYLARVIDGARDGKVLVRLDGSQEELEVSPSCVRLPK